MGKMEDIDKLRCIAIACLLDSIFIYLVSLKISALGIFEAAYFCYLAIVILLAITLGLTLTTIILTTTQKNK